MVSILQFPGTNCEFDIKYVYEKILGIKTQIIWHKQSNIPNQTKLIVIPGGFSYGDYLRSGAIACFSPIIKEVKKFAKQKGRILGICNGFQILTESGLLPGILQKNKTLHFISKKQKLIIKHNDNPFLKHYKKNEVITLPIAHSDGSYYIDNKNLNILKSNHQILMEYTNNINGSVSQIAGICNKEKNIFGLMPHPERAVEDILGNKDGLKMLESIYKE